MIRCLLLGASGFVGRHVRRQLGRNAGIELVTVDRHPEAGADVVLDVVGADPTRLAELVGQAGSVVVVNCAGVTGANPWQLVTGNVVVVAAVLAAIERAGGTARLIHMGSAAEYGPVPVGESITEGAACRPTNAYGVTKLAGTSLVLGGVRRGLTATVLRLFNLVGPDAPAALLPGRLMAELRQARHTGRAVRVGPLDGHRDFIDVRDAAAAVAAAACARRLPPLLNIGSGRATPVRVLAAEAVAAAGGGGEIREDAEGSPRSGTVSWQCADITAAHAALDWQPAFGLRRSVRDMWAAAMGAQPAGSGG